MKYRVTAAEHAALDEATRAHYGEPNAEGVRTLRLEGVDIAALTAKVDEFRTNNIALAKRAETAEAALEPFKGLDPATTKDALKELAKLKETGVTKPDDVALAIQRAVESAVAPLKETVSTLTAREQEANARAARAQFVSAFDQVALDNGVSRKALTDARMRAEAAGFRLVDGNRLVQFKGDAPAFVDGQEVSAKAWITSQLRTEADHLFERNAGGDAPGAGGGPGPAPTKTLVNPSALEMGQNLADIASGKVAVTVPGLD